MNSFRYSLRRLGQQPGFAAMAVFTLGLCIGANLLMFSVIHAVLLKPLPFPGAERLVTVFNSYPDAGQPRSSASVRDYFTRRGNIPAFESVSSFRYGSESVGESGAVIRRESMHVTPEFFDTLGVRLARGRSFTDDEMAVGADKAVVVSDRYWRSQMNAIPDPIGREIEINDERKTVVGLLPAGFRFLSSSAQLFLPLVSSEEQRALNALHGEHAEMIARLRPGATAAQALAQLEAHYGVTAKGYPWAREVTAAGFAMYVVGLHGDHVAPIRSTLWLLQAGVLCLLLIGGVNLLNLLLVRASVRSKELGVRRALGAGRGDLLKQVLSETLLLSLGGAGLGMLIAVGGLQLMDALGAGALPLAGEIRLDRTVLSAALLAALLFALLLALAISSISWRRPLLQSLQTESRGSSSDGASQTLRKGFIVAQIALALLLLSGAGLLQDALREATTADPGFAPTPLITANLSLSSQQYPNGTARLTFADQLLDAIERRPEIEAAGLTTNLPVRGKLGFRDNNAMTVIGYQPRPGVLPLLHNRYGVAGDYFSALRIPLLKGRYLDRGDLRRDRRVCVVDEDFARFYWPEGDALGQRLFEGPDPRDEQEAFTVVGVVGSVRQNELTDARGNGTVYFPYQHLSHAALFLSARSATPNEEASLPILRAAIGEVDPRLPIDQLMPMTDRIDATLVARRSPALLATAFALSALLLAGLGTFGVLSYAAAQRRREMGMRIALGAQPRQIIGRFIKQALSLFAVGAALGLLGTWLGNQLMQRWLDELPPLQASNVLIGLLLLGIVTLLASALPAVRAARTSPIEVLAE